MEVPSSDVEVPSSELEVPSSLSEESSSMKEESSSALLGMFWASPCGGGNLLAGGGSLRMLLDYKLSIA